MEMTLCPSKYMLRICILISLLFFLGCTEEVEQPAVRKPAAKPVSKAKPDAKATVAEEKMTPEEAFVYSPIGQRDPFESLLKKEQEGRKAEEPKTPLEKFNLGQFRIQAILIGKGAPRAMVSAPDGKNYILKPGLKIGKNNGVIKEITKTAIVVEESTFDLAGNLIKGLQSITVTTNEEN